MKFAQYDLLTDRNNLRKLFEFCWKNKPKKPFRIDVERIGNTVVFIRWEEEEDVGENSMQNEYGRGFLEACSQPAHPDDLSSRLVVRFDY